MSKFTSNYMITMKDIVREGAPILRKRTQPVSMPFTSEDREALSCMLQYLKNSQIKEVAVKYRLRPGSGLSANQIGLNKRMFAALFNDAHGVRKEYMLVNPKITAHSMNMIYLPEGEGCLSVDRTVIGFVPRYERITLKAYDAAENQDVTLKFSGYGAIVMQHELDHLNGMMFYDHINKEQPFQLPSNIVVEPLNES